MPLSKRLQQLLKRLDKLEEHFLPKPDQFSLSGNYTEEQHDKTKAYLLLVHAELEAYFEDHARNRAAIALAHWQRTGVCPPVLTRLLLHHQDELAPISAQTVTKALRFYMSNVDKNHGIKEKNLLLLFLPVGLGHRDLDSRLVTACNQLGLKRGTFAHTSIKTHQQVDPKTERDNIKKNIIPELMKLDRKLRLLR